MKKAPLSLVALAAGAALLAAAALGAASSPAAKGGTLRLSRYTDVDSIDPALAYFAQSWTLEYTTCAKLFNFPDEDGAAGARVVPEVVERYTVSRDGKTYTFDLKQNFRFHTGAPVTAASFAAAFKRDANPAMRSPATAYIHEIVGADAVIAGKAQTIAGIRVPQRYRLQITLTKPLGDFTARLTMPFFCPVLPTTPVDVAGIDNPPGSGPYYVAERVVNRRIVLKRNPYYRGGRPANVDQIVYEVGPSREACLAATEQDKVDLCILYGIPETAYTRLVDEYGINRPGGRFFVGPRLSTFYFAFNHDRPAFKGSGQIPLKKAINYAIDRPALVRGFGDLAGTRDDQMLPPALGSDERLYPIRGADPATARKWLARAKTKPDRLVLWSFSDIPGAVNAAQIFAFDLKQIGIDVDVRYFEQVSHGKLAGTRGAAYDVTFVAWTVDYADPASYFVPLLDGENVSAGGDINVNYSYLDDPRVNARIRAANRLSGAARRKAWSDLDADLMRDNPPWAPFIHRTYVSFVSRSFGCYRRHPVYGVDLAAACKK